MKRLPKSARSGFRAVIVVPLLLLAAVLVSGGPQPSAQASYECHVWQGHPAVFADPADPPTHPIMRFSEEQRRANAQAAREAAPAASRPRLQAQSVPLSGGAVDLLPYLQYTPSERDQGTAGNCWVWAGTGAMEVALDVQNSVKDRLSIQYFDSNYNGGEYPWAACSGDQPTFAEFYRSTGIAIPWSNTNASYQDASSFCASGSDVPASSISTSPHYALTSAWAQLVPTWAVGEDLAITNIKYMLGQHKAVVFNYYLANQADWHEFFDFWDSRPESSMWSGGYSCGEVYSPSTGGGGHAVLCVGYNDTSADPAQHYWVILNSWGATPDRPGGLFRIPMHYDYDCADANGFPNTEWWTIQVAFSGMTPTVSTNTVTSTASTSATLNGSITLTSPDLTCDQRGFVWDNDTNSTNPGDAPPSGSGYAHQWTENGDFSNGTFGHSVTSLSQGSTYYVRACAHDSAGWAYGDEVAFLTRPEAPNTLTATVASTTQVSLSWNKGAGADRTVVVRKQGSAPADRTDGTLIYFGAGTSYQDGGLSPATTYYYRAWSEVSSTAGQQWSDAYAGSNIATTGKTGKVGAAGGGMVSFTASAGGIVGLKVSSPCPGGPDVLFPFGMFSFRVVGIDPGSTVRVTATFPGPVPASSHWYQCDGQGDWQDITSLVSSNDGDNVLVLSLTDGGPADLDHEVNGTIVDPSGPGYPRKDPRVGSAYVALPTQPVALPSLHVQSAALSAAAVEPGSPVTLNVVVDNTGPVNGSMNLTVYVNGQEQASRGVVVAKGSAVPVTFTISRNEPGTYSVYVGNVSAGSFEVAALSHKDIILTVCAALVLAGLLAAMAYVVRRRRAMM